MTLVQLNFRVDEEIKQAVEAQCARSGETIAYFVQEAILDRLEELEDLDDLKRIRHEPTRPFADLIRDLGLDADD